MPAHKIRAQRPDSLQALDYLAWEVELPCQNTSREDTHTHQSKPLDLRPRSSLLQQDCLHTVIRTDTTKLPFTSPLIDLYSDLFFCVDNINLSEAYRAMPDLHKMEVALTVLLI